jgi:hypothetical protein
MSLSFQGFSRIDRTQLFNNAISIFIFLFSMSLSFQGFSRIDRTQLFINAISIGTVDSGVP